MPTEADVSPEQQSVKLHRLRKAWQVSVRNWRHSRAETYFASTRSKARYRAWLDISDVYPDLRIIDLVARRAAWLDVKLPAPDQKSARLTAEERHCLLHAFGANSGDPTKAGYRDYFYTRRDDPPLVSLTRQGLMSPMDGDKFGEEMTYFVMTNEGKQVVLSLVPEYAANG